MISFLPAHDLENRADFQKGIMRKYKVLQRPLRALKERAAL
jgi:hypothetical protein